MKEIWIDGKKIRVASTIDAVGLFCPMPIIHLKSALAPLKSSDVLEVVADDPGFEEDLRNWCQRSGNKLLALKKSEDNIFTAYVEKT